MEILTTLRASTNLIELQAALAKAQGAFEVAVRDSVNPHFKQNYANIAAVRNACFKALSENGLAIIQYHYQKEVTGDWLLATRLAHSTGEWIESDYPLHVGKNDAQGFLAATTYARRAAWSTLIAIVSDTEDDDGEAVVGREEDTNTVNARRAQDGHNWATAQIVLVNTLDEAGLDAYRRKNMQLFINLKAVNGVAYNKLVKAMADREDWLDGTAQRNAPVVMDVEQPESVDVEPPEEVVSWFARALSDLPAIDDKDDLDSMDTSIAERIGDNTDLLQRWVAAVEVRRKQLRSRAVAERAGRIKT